MKNLDKLYLLLIIVLSSLPLITLLNPGLPITHDGQDHVARVANFYQSLIDGNLIPRWAGNLNWGYGHPILMFLYPLPSYLASFFHLAGFSLTDSLKAVFGLSYIFSALFMYLWLKDFLGKYPALVGSVIFIYAPYRFIDLYVRGAIGEHVAFIFMPALCYFLFKFFQYKKISLLLFLGICFSSAGLILSHNAISVMFFPLVFSYLFFLFYVYKSKNKFIFSLVGLGYGFLLSAFFWIPAFIEGKYTLRDIVTQKEALTRFVDFNSLLFGSWSYGGTGQFSVQLGLIQWIFIIFSPISLIVLYKSKKENSNVILLISSVVFLILTVFIMLPISSPVWEVITTLQKFQFPWRFLSISVFLTSMIASLVIYSVKNKKIQGVLFLIVLIFSIFFTKDYWKAKGFLLKSDRYFTGIYKSTTDTGESAPIWSVRFMEKEAKDSIEVISGSAKIKKLSRTSTKHSYIIDSYSNSRIKENTLYFPGWTVYLNGKRHNQVEFQDPNNRGLITFLLPKGKFTFDLVFENTKLRLFSNLISLISALMLVILIMSKIKWLKR